jgi:hypothetical protein
MSSKVKLNYAIDVVIGVTFILSALSGLILFFAPSGYQGGRNPYYMQPVLLLSTHTWDIVHTWSSISMIAGVGAHLVLHWNWMVCTTKRFFVRPQASAKEPRECPTPL